MPRGDGTGPTGMGPTTGRGAGFCGGFGMPGFANRGRGRGGAGRGGRGWRHLFYATGPTGRQRAAIATAPGVVAPRPAAAPEDELGVLKRQAESAAATLEVIRKRIDELKAGEAPPAARNAE